MHWADFVFVMETEYRTKIWDVYRHIELPTIEILHIPNDYEFMNKELVELLTDKINATLDIVFHI